MIIYQIYPRSFLDTNGDGIGDLPGIVAKLPYIADLGADAIWISPFFTSPMRDFGYDISDYRGVDPIFGTIQDFENIVRTAQHYGLKVLIDQVWGHCSDQHHWFQQSRVSRDNAKHDWFIWADPRKDGFYPNNWISIFGGPAWSWSPARGQYYLHHFHHSQPVLNLRNEAVFDAIVQEALFWVDMGIQGFRVDALPHFLHDPSLKDNPPLPEDKESVSFTVTANPRNFQHNIYTECHDDLFPMIEKFRAAFDATGKDIIMIGEIMTGGIEFVAKCCKGDKRMHSAYMDKLISTGTTAPNVRKVIGDVQKYFDKPAKLTWSLGNHDVVRLWTRLSEKRDRDAAWHMVVALYFCLEGDLFWYQADELGLGDGEIPFELIQDPFGKVFWPEFKGRDGCRTPMPWLGDEVNGGFSPVEKTWLPMPPDHKEKAVDRQLQNPESKLNYIKEWMSRRRHPVLTGGDLHLLRNLDDNVVGFTREYEGQKLICLFNFSEEESVAVDYNVGIVVGQSNAVIEEGKTLLHPNGYVVAELL